MALGPSFKFLRWGRGGSVVCRSEMVYKHQAIRITTITVTSFMICRAFSLDSGIPFVFSHQK